MSDEITIWIDDVQSVDEHQVTFLLHDGTVGNIFFDECRKNWVEYVNNNDFRDWDNNKVHITYQENKYIAAKDSSEDGPYTVFYSDPKVKMMTKARDYKTLTEMQTHLFTILSSFGYWIFDMS